MSVISNSALAGSSGQGGGAAGYAVERSLRFNSGDSAYLNRTPSSAGNQKTYTHSVWLKRADVATGRQVWFAAIPSASNYAQLSFYDNKIRLYFRYNGGTAYVLDTVALFRDTSAWYHVVVAVDSTQATSTDRVKIYVNGVNTPYTGTVFAQNTDTTFNSAVQHAISSYQPYASGVYFNGYMADIQFIDGQALAATDFGEFDTNNVWQPKEFAGTYGTNGFKLDFSDTSSNAALGTDSSGAGNNWSVNNLDAALTSPPSILSGDYVGTVTSSNGYTLSNVEKAFDGNTAFTGSTWTSSGVGNADTITWTPGSNVTVPAGYSVFFAIYYKTTNSNNRFFRFTNASGTAGSEVAVSASNMSASTNYWTDVTSALPAAEPDGSRIFSAFGYRDTVAYSGQFPRWYNVVIATSNPDSYNDPSSVTYLVDNSWGSKSNPGNDALRDSPVNGDSANDTGAGNEITGNYCTLNPLAKGASATLSNGNLDISSGAAWDSTYGTIGVTSGKWYWEQTMTTHQYTYTGIDYNINTTDYPGNTASSWAYLSSDNRIYNSGTAGPTVEPMPSGGGIIGFALDLDNRTLFFSINGVFANSANPATNSNPPISNLPIGKTWFPVVDTYNASTVMNFGQRPFAYTAPSGYKALCTANLPDPTIADGSTAFDASTWSGTGSAQSITTNMSPDLVWVKDRGPTPVSGHKLEDIVRGAGKYLSSNNSGAEVSPSNGISSFNANGYTLGTDNAYNGTGHSYVGWAWDAGSSNTTIAAGGLNSSTYTQNDVYSDDLSAAYNNEEHKGFDGNLTTTAAAGPAAGTITWTPSGGLSYTSSVRAYTTYTTYQGQAAGFRLNGGSLIETASAGWYTLATGSGTINSISHSYAATYRGGINAIEVDGKILVDSGVTPPNVPSIASTVRANPSAGFSIVSYSGNNTQGATIGHNLNAEPHFVVIKNRDLSESWDIYHKEVGYGKVLRFSTSTPATANDVFPSSHTSSVIKVGNSSSQNGSSKAMIAYCFAPVSGYSSAFSWSGTGSTDGPAIYLGFRPKLIIWKRTDSAANWAILDSSRSSYNVADDWLGPNSSSSEAADNAAYAMDFLSNGLKIRATHEATNQSGGTYVGFAWAENPFKNSRAR